MKLGENEEAIKLYHRMQDGALSPDKVTLSCILKACSGMGAVGQGRLIHLQVIESKLESDVVVGSALIEMYAKAGYIEEARRVFDKLPAHKHLCFQVGLGYSSSSIIPSLS